MRSNFILDPCPEYLNHNGLEVRINADFRAVLSYSRLLAAGDLEHALSVLFPDGSPVIDEGLVEQIEWFMQCGIDQNGYKASKKLLGLNNNQQMDFDIDARYIWSAFMITYNINLKTVPFMHWWDFMELLEELPEETRLERIIRYRTIDINGSGVNKSQKKVFDALQRQYKISDKKPKDEKLLEALRNGSDISEFLNKET